MSLLLINYNWTIITIIETLITTLIWIRIVILIIYGNYFPISKWYWIVEWYIYKFWMRTKIEQSFKRSGQNAAKMRPGTQTIQPFKSNLKRNAWIRVTKIQCQLSCKCLFTWTSREFLYYLLLSFLLAGLS